MFVEQGATLSKPAAGAGDLTALPTEQIEAEIGELAAHIAAATCRWLELVAEFDRREGHEAWGFPSCAAWVAWRCSMEPRSAREHVRVARAIAGLPLVRESFRKGELSYSKVRAITRIAGAETEEELVELARHATAAQLERVVRDYRRAIPRESAQRAHEGRFLSCTWEQDGSLSIRGRLSPEEGALLLKALEAGRDEVRREAAGDGEAERAGAADALVLIAESSLATSPVVRAAGERHQVVVHVDAEALTDQGDERRSGGECRLDDGPAIAVETARRLGCDGALVGMLEGPDGTLSVGRRTRAIPPSVRRALRARDRGCRFPGCENTRWVDAHHIRHWAHGGETKLDNLIQLCGRHHRLVHEGGFSVARRGDGSLVFRRPDGREVPAVPKATRGCAEELLRQNRRMGVRAVAQTIAPLARGEKLDYGLAVAGLVARSGTAGGAAVREGQGQWRGPASQLCDLPRPGPPSQ